MPTGKDSPRRRIASVKLVGRPPEVCEPCDYALNPSFVVYLGILSIFAGVTSAGLCVYTSIAKIHYLAEYAPHNMTRSFWYYDLLFPLTLPVTVVAVYLCCLSFKLFKHAGYLASLSTSGRSYGLASEKLLAIVYR